MPLPPFNANGDLPAGMHATSLQEALAVGCPEPFSSSECGS
jgi:hypothetical protein